jgi:hypothetical protein
VQFGVAEVGEEKLRQGQVTVTQRIDPMRDGLLSE